MKQLSEQSNRQNATIKDVAKKAGVSISTVSRVINGNYPVRQELRARVDQAVEALDFHPHMAASSLRTGRSYSIGLIISRLDSITMMRIAKGLERVVQEENYDLLIASTNNQAEREREQIRSFMERAVDALVVATAFHDASELEPLLSEDVPMVLIDRRLPGAQVDTVLENNYEASLSLTRHALQKGHRSIAFLDGIEWMQVAQDRYNGFCDALREVGATIAPEFKVPCNYNDVDARREVGKLLDDTPRDRWPTLLYATNMLIAKGTSEALFERGLRVPEDISMMVYGDLGLPRFIQPQLTCVRQSSFEMGTETGRLVLRRLHEIHDKDKTRSAHKHIIVKSPVIEGTSIVDLTSRTLQNRSDEPC